MFIDNIYKSLGDVQEKVQESRVQGKVMDTIPDPLPYLAIDK